MTRVCLNMIVKNEAAILERCLRSVAAAGIGEIVIADTGSTDGTQSIARGFGATVVDVPFANFSQARNAALEAAWRLSDADYLLLLDADHELVGKIGEPTEAAYTIKLTDDARSYWRVQLIRRDCAARYIGATHEYLDTGRDFPRRLTSAAILDHACGGNRPGKFQRDIDLLLPDAVRRDPRSVFYLARSYHDSGDFTPAAKWYNVRQSLGGWEEERWYAAYMRALCHRVYDPQTMEHLLWYAHNERPQRSEPLYHLAKHHREHGLYDICCAICEIGKAIPYPVDDALFIEDRVYLLGFAEEMSIAGYYSKIPSRREVGLACCNALASQTVDKAARELAISNLKHYEGASW